MSILALLAPFALLAASTTVLLVLLNVLARAVAVRLPVIALALALQTQHPRSLPLSHIDAHEHSKAKHPDWVKISKTVGTSQWAKHNPLVTSSH